MSPPSRRAPASRNRLGLVLGDDDGSLLDVVDNVLSKGVVLTGELSLGLAQVDLVYAQVSLLLCAVDRIMPGEPADPMERRAERRRRRQRVREARRRG